MNVAYEMKESAVRVGDLPTGWEMIPLSKVTRECRVRNNSRLDEKFLCGVLKSQGLVPMRERVKGESTERCKIVSPGAFAYNPMRLNIGSIAMNSLSHEVMVSPDYVVFEADKEKMLPSYLNHFRRSWLWETFTGKAGDGSVRVRIYYNQLADLDVPTPPLAEQKRISEMLTAVDDKLDVIARQIEAAQTLKRGLMRTLFSRGVGTQGANGRWIPHIAYKDSDLGEIPMDWGVMNLESLSESITVGIATSTTEHYVDDGVPLVRNQNIKEDFLDMSDLLKISRDFDEVNKRKRVQEGDILTVRTGYPGVSCVVPGGLGRLQSFTTLITRPNRKLLNPHFASRYFNSPKGKELMLHQAAGGAQQNINAGNLRKLLVPVPPLAEQQKITDVLQVADEKCRNLTAKKEHYQELKRGLMQKLLTGEWRVRLDSEPVAA
ncbi:restriction endonuclease subunit S [Burkholderia pseudomallei]|uniref:restriction endonuclease subunit S n=1 Tax=Burkholderia pseudomallei TaxID=28450 RepID=UPI004059D120